MARLDQRGRTTFTKGMATARDCQRRGSPSMRVALAGKSACVGMPYQIRRLPSPCQSPYIILHMYCRSEIPGPAATRRRQSGVRMAGLPDPAVSLTDEPTPCRLG